MPPTGHYTASAIDPASWNTPADCGLNPWLIVALLFSATLLNYLDRQTISVLATRIADDPSMQLTDAHLGQIFFAFLLAYGIAQLAIGPLLDRLSVRLAYSLAVTAWSFAGAAAALASGFWSLLGLRMLLGVCESPNWPLALRVVSRTIPPNQRALASGLFQCGTSVGALIAPPIIIWLTMLAGWRFSFVAIGTVGLVWAVIWLAVFTLRPDGRLEVDVSESNAQRRDSYLTIPASLGEILSSRAFWGLAIATCFLNPLQYFYVTWLPRYFEKYAGVEFGGELAKRLVIVYLALDAGLILGGAGVWLLARQLSVLQSRRIIAAIGAACMMPIVSIALLRSLDVVTAIICLATFGLGCFMVNYLACTAEVSQRKVSTAAGLLGGTGSLAGAVFMWLVGDLVTRNGNFSVAFVLAGFMPPIALAGLFVATLTQSTDNP